MRSRDALAAAAQETIAKGSRSFAMASRLFDRSTRERSWLLYAWCRHCDDVSDGQVLGHGTSTGFDAAGLLHRLRDRTARALAGEAVGEMPFDALGIVTAECGIPHRFIHDHLAGFALDAEGWRPRTEADLLRYCYHVAGAVGCMMAVAMGVPPEEEETLDRASDLGIAFQLANIARDLVEDASVGRCYIPADWLDESGLSPQDLVAPANRDVAAGLARRLADLSARYEASGRSGAHRLSFRSRWAVLAAAGIYGDIAREVAHRGPAAWEQRVVTRKRAKIGWIVKSWAAARRRDWEDVPRDGLWTRPA